MDIARNQSHAGYATFLDSWIRTQALVPVARSSMSVCLFNPLRTAFASNWDFNSPKLTEWLSDLPRSFSNTWWTGLGQSHHDLVCATWSLCQHIISSKGQIFSLKQWIAVNTKLVAQKNSNVRAPSRILVLVPLETQSQVLFKVLSTSHKKRELQSGLPLTSLLIEEFIFLLSARVLSGMPLPCGMGGNPPILPPVAPVDPIFSVLLPQKWLPNHLPQWNERSHCQINDWSLSQCLRGPTPQPVTGEVFWNASAIANNARLDIAANGFWGADLNVPCLMWVFNPLAPSNRQPLPSCYREHENQKRAYEQEFVKLSMAPSLSWSWRSWKCCLSML